MQTVTFKDFNIYFFLQADDELEREFLFGNEKSEHIFELKSLLADQFSEQLDYMIQIVDAHHSIPFRVIIKEDKLPIFLFTPDDFIYLLPQLIELVKNLSLNKQDVIRGFSYPGAETEFTPFVDKNLLIMRHLINWSEYSFSVPEENKDKIRPLPDIIFEIPLKTFLVDFFYQLKWLYFFKYQLVLLKALKFQPEGLLQIMQVHKTYFLPYLLEVESSLKKNGFWDEKIDVQPDWYVELPNVP